MRKALISQGFSVRRHLNRNTWWGRTDSNHRSDTQQIYSLSPLATRELPHIQLLFETCPRSKTVSDWSR